MCQRLKLSPLSLLLIVSAAGIALFFLYAIATGAHAFAWLDMESNGKLRFCDYYMHIAFVADRHNLYSRATGAAGCFPPLAYVMYWILYRLTAVRGYVPNTWTEAWQTEYSLQVFMYYTIFVLFLLFLALCMWGPKRKAIPLYICLILSVPFFAGGVERGNSTVLIVALLLIALKLRESKSHVQRELALLILSICIGFKLYPAIFGLLYLKEHRYAEIVRLVVYSLVLTFAPFAFFGGIDALQLWINNIASTMSKADFGRVQYIRGVVETLQVHFFGASNSFVTSISPYLFLAAMCILAWLSKNRAKTLLFLCSAIAFFPSNAYRYTLCYLCIPLAATFLEDDMPKACSDVSWQNYAEALLYSQVFSIPMLWGALTSFKLSFPYKTLTYVELWEYGAAYCLVAFAVISEIVHLVSAHKKNALDTNSPARLGSS